MQVINMIFMANLLTVALIDFKTYRVPLWSLVALCAMCLVKGHLNVLDAILGASLMIASLVLTQYILTGSIKEEGLSLGGWRFWIEKCFPISLDRLNLVSHELFARIVQISKDEEENTYGKIGGGDFWIGTVMSLFMGFDKFLIAYTVAALLGMVAMMTVHRNFKDVAYVPYLAAGAFWAMFISR